MIPIEKLAQRMGVATRRSRRNVPHIVLRAGDIDYSICWLRSRSKKRMVYRIFFPYMSSNQTRHDCFTEDEVIEFFNQRPMGVAEERNQKEKINPEHYTHVVTREDELGYEVWSCDYCGAHAGSIEIITHYDGCIRNDPEAIKNLERMVQENAEALMESEE